jgi:molybdate transport system substrate-binding protein
MKIRSLGAQVAIIFVGCAVLWAAGNDGKVGEVRVLCSNGMKAVVEQVRPQMERAIGHPLSIEFSSTASFKEKIDAGATFDVAILTSDMMNILTKENKIATGTRADVARTGVGIGVRAGAPKPDISTPDKLKQALLKAKSITYTKNGASAVFVTRMIDRLGIAAELKPKLIADTRAGHVSQAVAEGRADMVLTLISEILPVHGVQFVGPLPQELQGYTVLTAGVGAQAKDAEAAKAAVKFLAGSSIEPILKAKGMEPAPHK